MTTTTSGTTGSARRELVPSRRVRELSESVTLAITARAKALRAAGQDVIGFGAGEPDFCTPAHVVEAAQRACADLAMHRYSPTPGCRRCARRSPGSRAGLGPAGPARRGARQQRLEACAVQRLPGIARPR